MRALSKLIQLLLLSGFIFSCSTTPTLNIQKHTFSVEAKKIIWLQIAGFDYKQLPMVRYTRSNSTSPTSLEKFDCIGGMWNYNLYKIRPSAHESFLSQLTGKKNIKKSCLTARYTPFWKGMGPRVPVGIFETEMDDQKSFQSILSCKKRDEAYNSVWLWRMGSAPDEKQKEFHYLDRGELKLPGIYYDRSCQKGGCFSSFYSNIISLFDRFSKGKERYLFVVRDFTYAQALKNRKIPLAREILSDLDKVTEFFIDSVGGRSDTLLIVTSAETQRIELPPSGKGWKNFMKDGRGVRFYQSGLSSVVMARGARAENFCGIYEESEVAKRMLFTPKEPQGFEALFKK